MTWQHRVFMVSLVVVCMILNLLSYHTAASVIALVCIGYVTAHLEIVSVRLWRKLR